MKQKLPRINPTTLIKSLGRLSLIATFSLGLGTLKNWGHYNSYWHGTIFRVQTVDFNILSHTLPGKLSYTLLQGNTGELQRTLDSNYGLFGLIVTDCKMAAKDCLSEQILYQSKSSQKWTKEISLATLSNHPYDLLQNPPPLQAERQYAKPRDSKPIPTGRVNSGEIIGRVYYVRGVPPTFSEDYNDWIKEPFKVTGSRTLYTSTVVLFFVSGLSAWIIIELVLSAKRKEQHLARQQGEQLQREIQQIKLQLEEKNQQTIELISQRERGLAELESYRQEQEQNKRELENQIASYESELALKEQQQQETAQTLEDLQLLRQKLQEASQRESEAKQQIKLQLEEKNQQTIELADQRERVVAELESYRQEQEQNKRELENQIASYESELALKEQQQQKAAQTLEDLQLLRQELQETSQRESEAKQRSEALNQKIAALKRDRDSIQQQSRRLEQQLEIIPNINELTAALEGARAESERFKAEARDWEVFVLAENTRLEEENADLEQEKVKLKSELDKLESDLSAAQENTQTLENIIEDLNVRLQNLSQNSHSAIPWSQLPRISGREAIGSLQRLGFRRDRQNGGHVFLKRVRVVEQIDSCTVPIHDELDSGTLGGIIRQANVTLEEFLDNL
ncbi:type II toxin-antitoxin system HicA family toxin [Microcoleus sp.]|uniref:type II toxin-antitoxin system HicA family toxin n=1 Tax=Microcoleus sp. TaxID=44472 RepID=UPI003525D90E